MSLKKVLLIGDSVRMGYEKYVKHALKDMRKNANVIRYNKCRC